MNINNINYFPIPNFENYLISDNGDIFSKITNKILKPWINKKGYKCIDLVSNKIKHKCRVHRLVALCFIGECPDNMVVRHLDGNSLNNNITNLCYGTQSDNEKDSVKHGTHVRNSKITKEQAIEIAKDERPYKQIAEEYKVSASYVSDIKCGINWKNETEGFRYQRGRNNPSPRRRQFTQEQINFILDKNNSRQIISETFNIPISAVKRVRHQFTTNI